MDRYLFLNRYCSTISLIFVKRELVVNSDAQAVWAFVKDMGNWASQMPGYISHELLNDDDSVWTVQVNVGAFTRPVIINVHVIQWLAPSEVTFEVKGRSEPFRGRGAFRARPDGNRTAISIEFGAEGTGSMATVISSLVPPVLDYVGDGFTANLARILGEDIFINQAPANRPGLLDFWRRAICKVLSVFRRKQSN